MEAGVARGEGGGEVIFVAVKRPGCSWERHWIGRRDFAGFVRNLDRQGFKYRTPAGR